MKIYGIELIECDCGVWRVEDLPCWNETEREQLTAEAFAQLRQALRNLGYEILKVMGLK